MTKSATCQIIDIVEKNGLYLFSVEIKASIYKFRKVVGIRPLGGEISVEAFKNHLRPLIDKEVKYRKTVAPIKHLGKDKFVVEF
jgi:hypothetical protein